MSLSTKIREQIISSFRAELAEHVQTLNDGLLALEQQRVAGLEKEEILGNLFRAAHSLKGAARAVGVSAIEQLAHALEDVLGALQHERLVPTPEMFTACYNAIDAIQATQVAYEDGETTPPSQSLQALVALEAFRSTAKNGKPLSEKTTPTAPTEPLSPLLPTCTQSQKTPAPNHNTLGDNFLTDIFADMKEEPDDGNPTTLFASEPPQPPELPIPSPTPGPLSTSPLPVMAESAGTQPAPVQPPTTDETIRVSVSKLDALMAQLSELLVTKIHAQQRLSQMRQAQEFMAVWQKEWVNVRSAHSRLTRHGISDGISEEDHWTSATQPKELENLLDYVRTSQERMREMNALVNTLFREYNSDTRQMALVIDRLEDEIKRVRMLPLNTITGTFARMVRDLAQTYGKQAVLEITGSEVELDKRVLEQIKDPLIHLLRNALDHGIETPEKRLALGKPACGNIILAVEHSGKDVTISVSDDGAGMDIEAIRKAALRRNILNAVTLSEAELVELIYHPGFSATPIITDVSGRGVGLDVVRRNIEILHGRINLEWARNQGSTFILTIPLSLTSSRGLLVRASDHSFAIPLNAIERILQVHANEVSSIGGHDTLRYEGRPLMLAHLGDVLELPRCNGQHSSGGLHLCDQRISVVILSTAERRMAFVIDELINEQELVIKGLGRQLTRVGGIAGASLMGSGEVILILQTADLIKLAQHSNGRSVLDFAQSTNTIHVPPTRPQPRILVVDDSITTRTLEKNILEAAGYSINLATNGQEALNMVLTDELPDLIISDIAMPKMDGFDLCKSIKSGSNSSQIPIILVTSLDSPEDKARGIECGADAYIIKSSFNQENLLETISQLI
jgi:two-component system chemotaxis sensor kinase CheA